MNPSEQPTQHPIVETAIGHLVVENQDGKGPATLTPEGVEALKAQFGGMTSEDQIQAAIELFSLAAYLRQEHGSPDAATALEGIVAYVQVLQNQALEANREEQAKVGTEFKKFVAQPKGDEPDPNIPTIPAKDLIRRGSR